MKRKMTKKKKFMAYILNKDEDFNCSMKKIAELLSVSQSTISVAIKEVEYEQKIRNLENELKEVKAQLPEKIKDDALYIDIDFEDI